MAAPAPPPAQPPPPPTDIQVAETYRQDLLADLSNLGAHTALLGRLKAQFNGAFPNAHLNNASWNSVDDRFFSNHWVQTDDFDAANTHSLEARFRDRFRQILGLVLDAEDVMPELYAYLREIVYNRTRGLDKGVCLGLGRLPVLKADNSDLDNDEQGEIRTEAEEQYDREQNQNGQQANANEDDAARENRTRDRDRQIQQIVDQRTPGFLAERRERQVNLFVINENKWIWQYSLFVLVCDLIDTRRAEHGLPPIPRIFQDPSFTMREKYLILKHRQYDDKQRRNTIVEAPEASSWIDKNTFLYGIHLPCQLWPLVINGNKTPQLFIGQNINSKHAGVDVLLSTMYMEEAFWERSLFVSAKITNMNDRARSFRASHTRESLPDHIMRAEAAYFDDTLVYVQIPGFRGSPGSNNGRGGSRNRGLNGNGSAGNGPPDNEPPGNGGYEFGNGGRNGNGGNLPVVTHGFANMCNACWNRMSMPMGRVWPTPVQPGPVFPTWNPRYCNYCGA